MVRIRQFFVVLCGVMPLLSCLAGPVSAQVKFHRNPTYSDVCAGGDCIADFVPIHSAFVMDVLCNHGRAYFASHSWTNTVTSLGRTMSGTVTSPTCSWTVIADNGSARLYTAVAFDSDGIPYARVGAFGRLADEGAVRTPSNAEIVSKTADNVHQGLPVYYSDLSPQALIDLGAWSGAIKPLDVYESDTICRLGRFEPFSKLAYSGDTVLFGPTCVVTDPQTRVEEIVVFMDTSGRSFLINTMVVDRLLGRN